MLFTNSKLQLKINDFVAYLKQNDIVIDKILLYGSYANGCPNQDSDIDLAVWIDNKTKLDYDKLNALTTKFYPIHSKFYSFDEDENDDPFIEIINKTGRKITLH